MHIYITFLEKISNCIFPQELVVDNDKLHRTLFSEDLLPSYLDSRQWIALSY